jgi:hypothetical protein
MVSGVDKIALTWTIFPVIDYVARQLYHPRR